MMKETFKESDYEVVEFNQQIHPRIKVQLMYYELGFSTSTKIYARRAVLERLLQALNHIPDDTGFLVWDIYRPRSVQAILFDWMRNEIRKHSPQLTDEENHAEAMHYAALPSPLGEHACSPHLSGGAIDLTLIDLATGQPLEMGTVFDDCTERAHRDYFNRHTALNVADAAIKCSRDYLRAAMERVGFVSYSYEWWHFDLGDRLWGKVTGNAPVFGPLFGDAEWP
jgi:D-alanyl-D-alanine dipeptidase